MPCPEILLSFPQNSGRGEGGPRNLKFFVTDSSRKVLRNLSPSLSVHSCPTSRAQGREGSRLSKTVPLDSFTEEPPVSSWQLLGPSELAPGPTPPLLALCVSKGQHQSDSRYHLHRGCFAGAGLGQGKKAEPGSALHPSIGPTKPQKKMAAWASESPPGQPTR